MIWLENKNLGDISVAPLSIIVQNKRLKYFWLTNRTQIYRDNG